MKRIAFVFLLTVLMGLTYSTESKAWQLTNQQLKFTEISQNNPNWWFSAVLPSPAELNDVVYNVCATAPSGSMILVFYQNGKTTRIFCD